MKYTIVWIVSSLTQIKLLMDIITANILSHEPLFV